MIKYKLVEVIALNIDKQLAALSNNEGLIKLIKYISHNYKSLSYAKKLEAYKQFNSLLNRYFNTDLKICANHDYDDEVVLSYQNDLIILNGLNNNPYVCLKEIVFNHLFKLELPSYGYYQLGNICYDENYLCDFPKLFSYNEENFQLRRKATSFIDSLLGDINDSYKKEYQVIFEKFILESTKKDLIIANNVMDEYLKKDVLTPFKSIIKICNDLFFKEKLSKKELALLSLDEVVRNYIYTKQSRDINKSNNHIYINHLNQFIKTFYPEYANNIKITIDKKGLAINGNLFKENQMFLDLLMQEIAKIENKKHYLENNDLDTYFEDKLKELDILLANRHLEIINYVKWQDIYNKRKKAAFLDKKDIFSSLVENEKFINCCQEFLLQKSPNRGILREILDMLNKVYYDSNFTLIYDDKVQASKEVYALSDNEKIYINMANNSDDNLKILINLFHEFRHLLQDREIKENHGIYKESLLNCLKLNNHKTSLGYNYSYAEIEQSGYMNNSFYYCQPMEYDAELFSKRLIEKILQKLNINLKLNDEELFNLLDLKYIDEEKLSVKIYGNYLRINKIKEMVNEEEGSLLGMKSLLKEMQTYEDTFAIFQHDYFKDIPMEAKIKVYKLIGEEVVNISLSQDNKIMIDNKIIKQDTDYEILEAILQYKAIYLVRKKKLIQSQIKEYIYNEAQKFLFEKINDINAPLVYYYHSVFDKYASGYKKTKWRNR